MRNFKTERVEKISALILPAYDQHDKRASAVDALTDLRHFCDKHAIDFHGCLATSYQHYLEEK